MNSNPQTAIFLPMVVLIGLTFVVLFVMGVLRTSGWASGKLQQNYYRYFSTQDGSEPDFLRGFSRNFTNLLEVPVLFYLGCVVAYVTDQVDHTLIRLAWAFVVGRFAHTAIHLTYNNIWHRAAVFIFSGFAVIIFWIVLILRLF